jgi:hypothetical protein
LYQELKKPTESEKGRRTCARAQISKRTKPCTREQICGTTEQYKWAGEKKAHERIPSAKRVIGGARYHCFRTRIGRIWAFFRRPIIFLLLSVPFLERSYARYVDSFFRSRALPVATVHALPVEMDATI